MRVFAGPNGSGKSTVIDYVRKLKVNGRPVDFGYYINADEIARKLKKGFFSFNSFDLKLADDEFRSIALASGLVNEEFPKATFLAGYSFRKNTIVMSDPEHAERMAQIVADFLRKKLLDMKRKFSFETVFSHSSKLDIMREAVAAGYKVYLYFVSTESPEINTSRVQARVQKGGHDVPPDKIHSRYRRSLDLLYPAVQLAYRTFFFDNSKDRSEDEATDLMFANYNAAREGKNWKFQNDQVPGWFIKYYLKKVPDRKRER